MSAVVDAIGDVVGGVVDAVGSVVEGAVDLAGDVIQTVADNPLLIVAAIAAPYALAAMAGTAATGAGISLAGASLGEGLAFAPSLGAGIGSAGISAGAMTGIGTGMGISAAAMETAALGTALAGATLSATEAAASAIADPFTFAPMEQAATYGTNTLECSATDLATFDSSQTAASTVMGQSPTWSFDTNYLSSNTFTQAQQASSLASSPEMSFSQAIESATGGTITPNVSTSIFTNAWDTAKGIGQSIVDMNSSASKFMNQIGQTLAPGADPMIQKYITNTAFNTVANGGDLESAMKSGAIGTVSGLAGNQVFGATADTLGKTGASMLGNAATGATGTLLSGGDIGTSLLNAGIGAVGSGVSNIAGSPLLGGAVKTGLSAGLNGGDVGNALLSYGLNTGINVGSKALGMNTNNSPLGMIGKYATSALLGNSKPSTFAKPLTSSLLKTNNVPSILSSVTNNTNTITKPLANKNMPPLTADISTMQPVDISTLIRKT